jgi:4-hydroxybenzoate polyprenyltransferase
VTAETGVIVVRGSVPPLVRALRPHQWPKNLIVFAALIFSTGAAWHPSDPTSWWPLLWRSIVMFGAWCAASSAVYLVNDTRDREHDRRHPRKASRPIAAGDVSTMTALRVATILLVIAIPVGFALGPIAGAVLSGYVVLMLGYSAGLKSVPLVDVLILCAGVVARAVAGAGAIDVTISPWLYICSSLGAFFFASCKRWAEFRQLGGPAAAQHRPALAHYDARLLSWMVGLGAAGTVISYAAYTFLSSHVPSNGAMALTIPFVAFGLFRFLFLIRGPRQAEAPDRILFTDGAILASMACFVAVALGVLVVR